MFIIAWKNVHTGQLDNPNMRIYWADSPNDLDSIKASLGKNAGQGNQTLSVAVLCISNSSVWILNSSNTFVQI